MIKKEDYLKAKQIVQEYEKQLNISDVIIQVCDCVEPMVSADKKTCLVCKLKLEHKR